MGALDDTNGDALSSKDHSDPEHLDRSSPAKLVQNHYKCVLKFLRRQYRPTVDLIINI